MVLNLLLFVEDPTAKDHERKDKMTSFIKTTKMNQRDEDMELNYFPENDFNVLLPFNLLVLMSIEKLWTLKTLSLKTHNARTIYCLYFIQ